MPTSPFYYYYSSYYYWWWNYLWSIGLYWYWEWRNSESHENALPQQLVSNKDAFKAFETCMKWMEQQEDTNPQQVMLLQKLKNDAARKRSANLKQLSMTDFMHWLKPIVDLTTHM